MISDISLLLQRGWENIWKDKILWLFSFLVLLDPLIRLFIPIQKNADLPFLLFNLVEIFVSACLMFLSYAGVSIIAYNIAISKPVDIQTTFQTSKKMFWRIVALTFILFLFVSPLLCSVFVFSFGRSQQILGVAHNFFFTSIPLSVFAAMWYFVVIATIANDSKIGKSLKTAWTIFASNFVNLAMIGFLLACIYSITNVSIGMIAMLIQNNFEISTLSKLDFISPYLSFPNNNFYKLILATAQTIWRAYSTSVFTFAYLKYSGFKLKEHGVMH